ncbi:MAG: aminotransferase class I/II-fold pyridoxal phosphate-dependent enzyme, partial [Clostridiales bacterium]|nr:aminotransferase class I/II-fold pyridoxal phosphate-dependent enzyme [Clostridiales bacterium]
TRTWTENALKGKNFTVLPSQANFVFASHPNHSGKELLDGLRERGILVRWWDKPEIKNWLRISIGTDEDMGTLVQALDELI